MRAHLWRRRIVVIMAASIAASCQAAETPATAGAECASDANCMLGSWTIDCCPRCKPFAAPSSQVLTMDNKCRSMSAVEGRCPDLECPPHEGPDFIAKCVSGRCVVGP